MMSAGHHKCPIALALDPQWWISCLHDKHYFRRFWDSRPLSALHRDASQNAGGAFCLNVLRSVVRGPASDLHRSHSGFPRLQGFRENVLPFIPRLRFFFFFFKWRLACSH